MGPNKSMCRSFNGLDEVMMFLAGVEHQLASLLGMRYIPSLSQKHW
jgi:hypothetical protein